MKDLVVLAADKSLQLVLSSLLARPNDLALREISFDALVHPDRDPGVRLRSHHFLRGQLRNYQFAIAVCDRSGSGREELSRTELETRMEAALHANGWEGRASAVVIDPELEIWMWGDWPVTSRALRWTSAISLAQWLIQENLLVEGHSKPSDPKRTLECAAQCARKGWSSAIHQEIAGRAQCDGCTDPAFLKLRNTLTGWFGLAR
jgi:hypothetical protein